MNKIVIKTVLEEYFPVCFLLSQRGCFPVLTISMSVMLYAISKSFKFMKKLQNSDSIYGRNINLSISDYKKNIIKLVFEGKVGRLSSNMQFLKERLVVFYNLFFMVYYI